MLAGFKPTNHPQQVQVRGASDRVDERITPDWLVADFAEEFGPFDLDVAANADNAKAARFFDLAQDGLNQPWGGGVRVV